MTRITTLFAAIALSGAAGCAIEAAPEVGETGSEILMGSPDGHENVCGMTILLPPDDEGDPQDPIDCSCTLVEAQTILTSARCVFQNLEKEMLDGIDIRFGASFSVGDPYVIDEVELHRYFDENTGTQNELALVRLTAPVVGGTPVELNGDPLAAADIDRAVDLVGFGVSVEGGTFGSRRIKAATITQVGEKHVFAGEGEITCAGDSGGPVFDAGSDLQLAMTVRQGGCHSDTIQRLRIDAFAETFLFPYIDRFSGPCMLDDVCVEDGCRSPDPDCDECAWGNGVCKEDCPTRDWDCEIGSFVGEDCEMNGQCEEGGRCATAEDDTTFTYCTRPCDPAQPMVCPAGMECSELGGGEGECTYLTPSRGSQGFPCTLADQCRSGICEDDICVSECGAGGECPDPYVCGPSQVEDGAMVCLGDLDQGGGGFGLCSAGGRPGSLALVLLAIALMLRRRRCR